MKSSVSNIVTSPFRGSAIRNVEEADSINFMKIKTNNVFINKCLKDSSKQCP